MNASIIKARSLARRLGLMNLWAKVRPKTRYEDRFHQALQQAIRPNDVVWDVGANAGIYSELFLQWTAPEGHVVAFEPAPDTARKILERLPNAPRFTLLTMGMGSVEAELEFVTGVYDRNAHVRLPGELPGPDQTIETVQITTADAAVKRLGATPNVIKIDTEGFEEDVLLGMTETLRAPALRSVLVEVHFAQLEQRGQPLAPIRIEKLLQRAGFKVQWTDASHLRADRS